MVDRAEPQPARGGAYDAGGTARDAHRGGGNIVTVSSVNAFLPDPLVIDYSAAKAALTNFCKALSKEFGPSGIRVNTVSPGPVATDLWLGADGVAATVARAGGDAADSVADQAAAESVDRPIHPAGRDRRSGADAGERSGRQRHRSRLRDRRRPHQDVVGLRSLMAFEAAAAGHLRLSEAPVAGWCWPPCSAPAWPCSTRPSSTSRCPRIGEDLDAEPRRPAVDAQRLHADAGVVHPARRLAGGPVRPPPDLHRRHDLVRAGLGAVRRSRRTWRCWSPPGCCRASAARCSPRAAWPSSRRRSRRDDRARAIGAWSGLGGVAGAAGPFLGGWLVDGLGWRLDLPGQPAARGCWWSWSRRGTCRSPRDPTPRPQLDLRRRGARRARPGRADVRARSPAGSAGSTRWSWAPARSGCCALVGFVLVERRSRHPLVPPGCSRPGSSLRQPGHVRWSTARSAACSSCWCCTCRWSPGSPAAGRHRRCCRSPLLMLALSSRPGALAARIGPRLPMTAGPLVAAAGMLLMLRIGRDAVVPDRRAAGGAGLRPRADRCWSRR